MKPMKRTLVFLVTCISVAWFVGARGVAQGNEISIDRNVTARMRDGVILRADVYRPKIEGRFPVLLARTPYNKNVNNVDFAIRAAGHGYVFIVQDCRGRYSSEGTWEPFKYESDDGYDSVEWAASLPYSNGKVAMCGASYNGVTQMLAAIASPPHLVGIFPAFTASNYHDQWVYQGGRSSSGSMSRGRPVRLRKTRSIA
jgi:uncharacterized protein